MPKDLRIQAKIKAARPEVYNCGNLSGAWIKLFMADMTEDQSPLTLI
jgi:hypothetical protein